MTDAALIRTFTHYKVYSKVKQGRNNGIEEKKKTKKKRKMRKRAKEGEKRIFNKEYTYKCEFPFIILALKIRA